MELNLEFWKKVQADFISTEQNKNWICPEDILRYNRLCYASPDFDTAFSDPSILPSIMRFAEQFLEEFGGDYPGFSLVADHVYNIPKLCPIFEGMHTTASMQRNIRLAFLEYVIRKLQ